ncbi:hypothetical protein [Paenibacillus kobensis]|uniref:hypothetical protein n=1 Tax=Paenibacillus kobensis TaxID=59841 RepID=UPI000FDCAABB|nr:hypothetical protein [Paenibacillus kobensis]
MRSDYSIGLGLLTLGAGLAALGGLEKVILYAARPEYIGDSMGNFRHSVPDAIWNITNITLWSGVPFVLAGLYMLLRRSYTRISAQIKATNDRFEREHNSSK